MNLYVLEYWGLNSPWHRYLFWNCSDIWEKKWVVRPSITISYWAVVLLATEHDFHIPNIILVSRRVIGDNIFSGSSSLYYLNPKRTPICLDPKITSISAILHFSVDSNTTITWHPDFFSVVLSIYFTSIACKVVKIIALKLYIVVIHTSCTTH